VERSRGETIKHVAYVIAALKGETVSIVLFSNAFQGEYEVETIKMFGGLGRFVYGPPRKNWDSEEFEAEIKTYFGASEVRTVCRI